MINLLILAHPDKNSFQFALCNEAQNFLEKSSHEIIFHNLYADSFNPILPLDEIQRGSSTDELILEYQNDLMRAERILLFYPDWWGQPPAILKGWIDRILAAEVAYRWEGEDFLDKTWIPLLEGKEVHLFVTADGPLDNQWLEGFWKERVFEPCGATVMLHSLDRLRERSYGEIKKWMDNKIQNL